MVVNGDDSVGYSDKTFSVERWHRILDLTNKKLVVRVDELADMFQVSEVTIRKDLDALAEQGLVIRSRGGAIANTNASLTTAFDQRSRVNLEQKRRIGQAAVRLIQPGDTIIVDAGTTTLELVKNLTESMTPLTIVTNALNIATQAKAVPGTQVIQIGGSLNLDTISTYGPLAERELGELAVTRLFLGVHAVDPEIGMTDTSFEIAQVKRAMIRAAKQVILLADSEKWGQSAFAKIAPLTAAQIVISDTGLTPERRAQIENRDIQLLLV